MKKSIFIFILFLHIGNIVFCAEKEYIAESFRSVIEIEENGDLFVTEHTKYKFLKGEFTYAYRHIHKHNTNNIKFVKAFINDEPVSTEKSDRYIEIADKKGYLKITWFYPPEKDSVKLTVKYRAEGAVYQEENADMFVWNIIPTDKKFFIKNMKSEVYFPTSAEIITQPRFLKGNAEIVENPYKPSKNKIEVVSNSIEPNKKLLLELRFAKGSIVSEQPKWYSDREYYKNLTPKAVIGAVFLFAFILITLVRMYSKNNSNYKIRDKTNYTSEPPNYSPAVSGALLYPYISQANVIGTVFDLAKKGYLRIVQTGEKKWYKYPEGEIVYTGKEKNLKPHEEAVFNMIFTTKKGFQDRIKVNQLRNQYLKHYKNVHKQLSEYMEEQGLKDPKLKKNRKPFYYFGSLFIALGLITAVFMGIYSDSYILAIFPFTIVFEFLGIISFILGANINNLTQKGIHAAQKSYYFKNYLKMITKEKIKITNPEVMNKYLPYAAALGYNYRWVNYFKKRFEKLDIPNWFEGFENDDISGVFAAMIIVTSGPSGTGGGAGGAAGGGGGGGAGAG